MYIERIRDVKLICFNTECKYYIKKSFEIFLVSIPSSSLSLPPLRASVRPSRDPPTHHINLAVMAAPPDAESLESRISEYLKLIPPSQCRLKTQTLTNYYPRVVVGEMTAHHSSACPGRGD